jgi:hypothetical protein
MKASVILSLSLDVLAIVIMLVPAEKYRFISRDSRTVTTAKRTCFLVLLLAGFLIDTFVSHGYRFGG